MSYDKPVMMVLLWDDWITHLEITTTISLQKG